MEFIVKSGDELAEKGGSVAALFFEDVLSNAEFRSLDGKLAGALSSAVKAKEFSGKEGELVEITTLGNIHASKLFLVGLGKQAEFEPELLRKAFGGLARAASSSGSLAVRLPKTRAKPSLCSRAAVEGAELAAYEFSKYKKKEDGEKPKLEKVCFYCDSVELKAVSDGAAAGKVIASSTNTARALANEPPNVATPDYIAKEARKLASLFKLKCSIYDKKAIEKLGMNALLAVNSGSCHEPRLVVLEYRGAPSSQKPYAIVGKGITFDSGGISIKPSSDMDKMKFDKAGACAVLGIMQAARELSLKVNIVGVMALTENLPDGAAYKPGDIVQQKDKSIEILNTDAEGRVILSDALSYVIREFKPQAVIDLATLTGACVVALGDIAAGLFSNDDALAQDLYAAGQLCGERTWRLPVWKEYDEKNKSDVADIKNIGEAGSAGAITAACFLKAFVGDTKWAHLDIAGTGWNTKSRAYMGLGATGAGVRVVTEFLMARAGK